MEPGPRELPAGTVTFVFTDIEGSTRLFRALGDDYPALLDRHREILREAWATHGGCEVDTEGDSFFVAFSDVDAALAACADGQRALESEPWPRERVRVRMGVHKGIAVPRGRNYVAFAVHQAARVVDVGHGGQVVVSADAADGATLPRGHGLASLGVYRVRDFDSPVEVFQLTGPGLGTTFPALRALPADRHNLAVPLTPIIGRAHELDELHEVVRAGTVVTIVGPGGAGKTRLAVEHGLRVVDDWPDGVWFADLSAIDADALVPSTIAAVLGVRVRPDGDVTADVVAHLARRRSLLILDNAEHVRAAVASFVLAVLGTCRDVGVLVTSREPLALLAESVRRLGPLENGPELFTARARDAGAAVVNVDAAIEELCRRLDGLPLAIEMAAARAPMLSPQEMLAGLDGEARALVSRDPTVAARHRSLDELLAWSDRLLSAQEWRAMRCLAAFSGTFGYDTATVALARAGIDRAEAADLVWSLANRSLLVADPTAGGTRYRFPDTVRTYARRHDPDDDVTSAAERLAAWYLSEIGPDCALDRAWVARVAEEIDNVRGVISLVFARDASAAQQLAWTIGQYHDLVQAYRHGIGEIERYATLLAAPTPSQVGLLALLADLHLRVGDRERAATIVAEARALQDDVGSPPWDEVAVDRTESELALAAGDVDGAIRRAEEVLQQPISDRAQARIWNQLTIARFTAGDARGAADAAMAGLAALERRGLAALQVGAHSNLAEALLTVGDRAGAARHQREAMQLALQFGQPAIVAFSMMVAAKLAAEDGAWDLAVRLQAAGDERLAELGIVMYPRDRATADALLARGSSELSATELAAALEHGRHDTADEVLAATDAVLAAVSAAPSSLEREESPTHA